MGKLNPTTVQFNLPDGREVSIETGQLATQAHGSVVVRLGDTMMFASAVSSYEAREGQSFFPLSVDYQEKYAAAGRIPGNFFRREARLNDYEILTSRLVDRAIRPLFPDGYMFDTQIILNLISGDPETLPDALCALAASAALSVSDIPFAGPISEVRVARINGAFHINPDRSDLASADLDIIVAATMDNVMMVEGEAQECSEEELVEAIKVGHEAIKVQCQAQLDLVEKIGGVTNREVTPVVINEDVYHAIKEIAVSGIDKITRAALNKKDRKNQFKDLKSTLKEQLLESKGEEWMEENGSLVSGYFDKLKKATIREIMLSEGVRLDGRKNDQVRPIWTLIDYLPAAHGSAVFNRGETQALATVTLGAKTDEKMNDTALLNENDKFILHYNFPAFSVGETKPMRGPGRREVGHANLASRSLERVLPEDWAYTTRIVSDILESNGSSSMATVCAGSMALQDAGVPITKPVSGIAMGMISDGSRSMILSDILGDEDALGDMDFKVTGTADGITACQMDIKIDGLPYEQMIGALKQAREGRVHILNEMSKTISESRSEMKSHVPRIIEIAVDKNFIGPIIGPGGKHIQELQADTNTTISIEEVDGKGIVQIMGSEKAGVDAAVQRINDITFMPTVGDVYLAEVEDIVPFGAFMKFKGKTGLLHVSEISYERVENVEDVLKIGDELEIKLLEVDERSGKLRLSRKALLEKPEGYVERPRRDDRRGGGGDRRGGRRDDRRGGGGHRGRRDDRRRD